MSRHWIVILSMGVVCGSLQGTENVFSLGVSEWKTAYHSGTVKVIEIVSDSRKKEILSTFLPDVDETVWENGGQSRMRFSRLSSVTVEQESYRVLFFLPSQRIYALRVEGLERRLDQIVSMPGEPNWIFYLNGEGDFLSMQVTVQFGESGSLTAVSARKVNLLLSNEDRKLIGNIESK